MYFSTRLDGASATIYGILELMSVVGCYKRKDDTYVICDSDEIELIRAHVKFSHDVVHSAFVHGASIRDLTGSLVIIPRLSP